MSNIQTPLNLDGIMQVLLTGNLAKLNPQEKLSYYNNLCESLGLNPLTKPFQFITFQGKEILYATRDCADQLRKLHKISIKITGREHINGVYVVTAQASGVDGRVDESTGAVTTERLSGDALANAYLKCETKAKRRVTLSICGLGLLDETEIETIKDAKPVAMPSIRMPIKTMADIETEHAQELQKALKEDTDLMRLNEMNKALDEDWPSIMPAFHPGTYKPKVGKWGGPINGKQLKDIDPVDLIGFIQWIENEAKDSYKNDPRVKEFLDVSKLFIKDAEMDMNNDNDKLPGVSDNE